MKRNSIITKITIWYTVFILVIAVILVTIVEFSWADNAADAAQTDLIDEVTDASEHIVWVSDGFFLLDDEIELYDDNVYISIYDRNKKLIEGRFPAGVYGGSGFEDENISKVCTEDGEEWFIYDRMFMIDRNPVWVRGIIENPAESGSFAFIFRMVIICIPLLVIAAAVGGYIITKRAFAPVREVTEAARGIQKSGDLSRRIDRSGNNDEIDRLADAFNGMFDSLETTFNNQKQFISDVSHELRTPLAVMISQSEYGMEDAEYSGRALQAINRSAKSMSSLVSRLLTLSRSDSGRLNPEREDIDLSELCELTAEQQNVIAKEKGVSIVTDIQEGVHITGDYAMVIRILVNLIDNAVKYGKNPDGTGNVRLSLATSGCFARVDVADDGPGISEEHIDKIWDRFYQAGRSSNDSAGLGLSIVKSLTEVHGGKCDVKSKPGSGSVFSVWFPKN